MNLWPCGPDPGRASRARQRAALGQQTGFWTSKASLEPLVAHDVSLDEHMRLSANLEHPCLADPGVPLDTQFAVSRALARQRRGAPGGEVSLEALLADCSKLDQRCRAAVPAGMGGKKVSLGLVLVLSNLIGWPDWQLPDLFCRGFRITGEVQASNIWKRVRPETGGHYTSLFGREADDWNVATMRQLRETPYSEEVYKLCEKDRAKGRFLRNRYWTKQELDAFYGRGLWRCIRRSAHWEENHGKFRNIDNARTSGHNAAAVLVETIWNPPFDMAGLILREAYRQQEVIPQPRMGCEDLEDAFHIMPNATEQLPLCCVAFYHPEFKEARFAIVLSHFFGVGAAVNNFNRWPSFATAVARRLLGIATWHYFDDVGVLGFGEGAAWDQANLQRLYGALGTPFSEAKSRPVAEEVAHVGVLNDLREATRGIMTFQPKPGRVDGILSKISAHLGSGMLSSGEAASLRGE
eukprot:11198311-Lingulodinium_polyedra.AAC.1